jgi:hypothetical protein
MGTRGRQRTKEDETMKNNTTRHRRKRMEEDRQTASFSGKKVRGRRNTAKQRERASDRARGAPGIVRAARSGVRQDRAGCLLAG